MSSVRIAKIVSSFIAVVAVAACSEKEPQQEGSSEPAGEVDIVTSNDNSKPEKKSSGNPKLHPVKEFTIVYELSGMENGTITHHSKNWGFNQVQIKDATMNFMGMNQVTKQRSVTNGPEIITIDLATNQATRFQNPMYESIADAFEGKDPMEVGEEFMTSMGGVKTGETKEIAGEKCEVWSVAQMGSTSCVTKDGLTLSMTADMMGMKMEQVATEVRRKDSGPKEVYEVPEDITVTEQTIPTMPDGSPVDLQSIMEELGQGAPANQ